MKLKHEVILDGEIWLNSTRFPPAVISGPYYYGTRSFGALETEMEQNSMMTQELEDQQHAVDTVLEDLYDSLLMILSDTVNRDRHTGELCSGYESLTIATLHIP